MVPSTTPYGYSLCRGLGTRLNEAGVDDKSIQSILRHADVSTTMAYYVHPDRKAAQRGLRKLSEVLQKKDQGMMRVSGGVAQWLEHSAHNRLVAGSTPAAPTIDNFKVSLLLMNATPI